MVVNIELLKFRLNQPDIADTPRGGIPRVFASSCVGDPLEKSPRQRGTEGRTGPLPRGRGVRIRRRPECGIIPRRVASELRCSNATVETHCQALLSSAVASVGQGSPYEFAMNQFRLVLEWVAKYCSGVMRALVAIYRQHSMLGIKGMSGSALNLCGSWWRLRECGPPEDHADSSEEESA